MVKTRKTSFDTALAGKMNRIAAKETTPYRNIGEDYDPIQDYNSFEMLNDDAAIDSKVKQLVKFSTNLKKFILNNLLSDIPKKISEGGVTKTNIKDVTLESNSEIFTVRTAAKWFHKYCSVDVKGELYKDLSELISGKLCDEGPDYVVNMLTTFLYGLSVICGEVQIIKQAASVTLESVIRRLAMLAVKEKNFPSSILKFMVDTLAVQTETTTAAKKSEKVEKEENNGKIDESELTDF